MITQIVVKKQLLKLHSSLLEDALLLAGLAILHNKTKITEWG